MHLHIRFFPIPSHNISCDTSSFLIIFVPFVPFVPFVLFSVKDLKKSNILLDIIGTVVNIFLFFKEDKEDGFKDDLDIEDEYLDNDDGFGDERFKDEYLDKDDGFKDERFKDLLECFIILYNN